MQAKHLLTCSSCGEQHKVGRQQAGETIHCACGAALEVPTLRELSSLPLAPDLDAEKPPAKGWGLGERLILSGAVVCVLSLVGVAVLVFRFPERPVKMSTEPDQIRQRAAEFSPAECLAVWRELEATGVKQLWVSDQLGYHEAIIRYEDKVFGAQMGIGVFTALCGAGIGLVVAGSIKRASPANG